MKITGYISAVFAPALAALSLCSCTDAIDAGINELSEKVLNLEETVKNLTSEVSSLTTIAEALEKNVLIEKVTQNADGSCKIEFSDYTSIVIRSGTDGNTPVVSIKYSTAYKGYYWTINGNWMKDSNNSYVRATATTPQLKIQGGYWYYSLDGGYSWVNTRVLATGDDGGSFFRSINTSNENAVIFTLADGTVFTIPTVKGFETLETICSQVTASLEGTRTVLTSIDSGIFVRSIVEVADENGVSLGYDVTMEDGQVLNLRTGVNDTTAIYFSIRYDISAKDYYWSLRQGDDGTVNWLYYNGARISASPVEEVPVIGVADSLGVLYFTISHNGGEPEYMKDSSGCPIQASGQLGFRYFESFRLDGGNIVATLADGTAINLIKACEATPSLALSADTTRVTRNSAYTIRAVIRDTMFLSAPYSCGRAYTDSSATNLSAIAVDNGYVSDISVSESEYVIDTLVAGKQYAFEVAYDLTYRTGDTDFVVGRKSRVAAFLTFDSRTTMKVVEFDNVETEEE